MVVGLIIGHYVNWAKHAAVTQQAGRAPGHPHPAWAVRHLEPGPGRHSDARHQRLTPGHPGSIRHLDVLPLINAQRVALIDEPELLRELRELERRRGSGGLGGGSWVGSAGSSRRDGYGNPLQQLLGPVFPDVGPAETVLTSVF